MNNLCNYPLVVFAISFIAMWLLARLGWWFRSRQGTLDADLRDDFGFILAATLTLLGLTVSDSAFPWRQAATTKARYAKRQRPTRSGRNTCGPTCCPRPMQLRVRGLLQKLSRTSRHSLLYGSTTEKSFRRSTRGPCSCRPNCGPPSVFRAWHSRIALSVLAVSGMNDVLNSQGYTQAGYWDQLPIGGMGLDGGNRHRL